MPNAPASVPRRSVPVRAPSAPMRSVDMIAAGASGAISVYLGNAQGDWTWWSAAAMGAIAGAFIFIATTALTRAFRRSP